MDCRPTCRIDPDVSGDHLPGRSGAPCERDPPQRSAVRAPPVRRACAPCGQPCYSALVSAQEAPGERAAITEAIRSTRNLGAAARRLGVARKTLYNRMRALGLPRGKAGRPKRKLGRARKLGYATVAVAGVAVVAGIALSRRSGTQA